MDYMTPEVRAKVNRIEASAIDLPDSQPSPAVTRYLEAEAALRRADAAYRAAGTEVRNAWDALTCAESSIAMKLR